MVAAVVNLAACSVTGDAASPAGPLPVTEFRASASEPSIDTDLLADVVLSAGFTDAGATRPVTPPVATTDPLAVELQLRSRPDHRGDDLLAVSWRRDGSQLWATSWRLPHPTGTLRATLPQDVHEEPGDYVLVVSFRGHVLRSIPVEVRRG